MTLEESTGGRKLGSSARYQQSRAFIRDRPRMSVFARIGNTDIVSTDTDTVPIQRYRQIQIIYRLIGATLVQCERAQFAFDAH